MQAQAGGENKSDKEREKGIEKKGLGNNYSHKTGKLGW